MDKGEPYFWPWEDVPSVGETIWVIGQSITREEMPFTAVVLDVETYQDTGRNRLKLRGFRDDPQAEWSVPQNSFGFHGLYFRTELDIRTWHLQKLKNRERRMKRDAAKLKELINVAKDELKRINGKERHDD